MPHPATTARPAHAHGIGAVKPDGWAYHRAPMIVYWELTNACGLACRHCRATAMPDPMPGELTTAEAIAVLDDLLGFGGPGEALPHVVMTGGDPLRRPDLPELIAAATERGIGVSLAPAVTPLLTRERIFWMKDVGIQAISLSLDGSTAAYHDGVRMVPGTFEATIEALDTAAEAGLPVQVNTLVTSQTAADLPAVYELLSRHTLMQWSLFFLISIGRGTELTELSPGDAERWLLWAAKVNRDAPFRVKTTEAMHFRRLMTAPLLRAGRTREEVEALPPARAFGIRDGNGIVFVSNLGDVTPSGFLPVTVGNVKERSLVELYRDEPLMRALRDPDQFKGRCGVCEYHDWCGGSRARAYAWTGDPLESDPLCPYVPKPDAAPAQ
ncbi:MAG: TIGR04053 family radical SAM/SPASM domain-containing protein [Propionibacteriaceae bacterium]|nr:TIGR04053 family radical SAM/SPASM domain-containing protein [Propionibacteriaceae bacterium]